MKVDQNEILKLANMTEDIEVALRNKVLDKNNYEIVHDYIEKVSMLRKTIGFTNIINKSWNSLYGLIFLDQHINNLDSANYAKELVLKLIDINNVDKKINYKLKAYLLIESVENKHVPSVKYLLNNLPSAILDNNKFQRKVTYILGSYFDPDVFKEVLNHTGIKNTLIKYKEKFYVLVAQKQAEQSLLMIEELIPNRLNIFKNLSYELKKYIHKNDKYHPSQFNLKETAYMNAFVKSNIDGMNYLKTQIDANENISVALLNTMLEASYYEVNSIIPLLLEHHPTVNIKEKIKVGIDKAKNGPSLDEFISIIDNYILQSGINDFSNNITFSKKLKRKL